MADEWRVEVHLEDEGHGLTLGDRLKSLDLDNDARKRLGERVVVTRDGARMFLYTDTEERARAAEEIVRELAVADELEAKMRLTRWDPDADEWVDPGTPRPQSETERVEEHREHEKREEREAAATGKYDWELRVDLESLSETRELADRVRELAPGETEIHVEPAPGSIPHPAFVVIGGHTPGIGRDLGL